MPENEESKPVRVLLIEDNPDDAELTMAALGEIQSLRCLGERVGTLSQGLVRLSQGGVDILLLDLGLPDSLGLNTFELAYEQNPEELAARIVKEGAQDYLVKGKFDGHLLARAIRYAIERHKTKAELRSLSLMDELTGLYNRRGFLTLAEQQVKIANRLRKRLLLIYADMDNLKWINDTLGHKEGDQAIKDLADLLNHTFRASDLIARMGGDEFAVLGLEESVADFKKIRARLQQKAGARKESPEKPYRLSFSMGFVQYDPEKTEGIDELLARADRLMYEEKTLKKAKEKGRG
jgi:two-component system cell cycle response regulator